MPKLIFNLKGEYPGEYETNVVVMGEGKIEHKQLHFHERKSQGRIWVDGVELFSKRASQLRKPLSSSKTNFTWTKNSGGTYITALAMCLYLFDTEQTAVNMYLPFRREILKNLPFSSFEQDFDITEFYLDNFYRTSPDFHTLYYRVWMEGWGEITYKRDAGTGEYSCDILHQLCTNKVYKEKKDYETPSHGQSFFGIPDEPKAPFDWEHAYQQEQERLINLYFKEPMLSAKTKSTIIVKIKNSLWHYGKAADEQRRLENKPHVDRIKKKLEYLHRMGTLRGFEEGE